MTTGPVVLGVGAISPVGLSAPETAASVRAGAARFEETTWMDVAGEPFVAATVPADGLPGLAEGVDKAPLSDREFRLLRLATMPLLECLKGVRARRSPVRLLLTVTEAESWLPLNRPEFVKQLAAQVGHAFDPAASEYVGAGRAGGLAAIGAAVALISQGQADLVVAGGVDTYYDLDVLDRLDRDGRVKSARTLDGFIPGEAAAFVLVGSRDVAAREGLTPLAHLSAVAHGFEAGHMYSDEPYRGDGLAATFTGLFQSGEQRKVGAIYSSMNGESYWAREYGVARIRNSGRVDSDAAVIHPADCLGDVGAACGPMFVALASLGVATGTVRSPCLVYGSSDAGGRAALAVSAMTG